MEFSEKLDKLAPALAKAQAEMATAKKDSDNPFFKSKYADLASVWEAIKDALHSNGLSVIQSPVDMDGRIGCATMLLHESGQYIRDEFTLGVKKQNDPQADGSSITYARRYALAAFTGVIQADDDAESAMNRKTSKKDEFVPYEPPAEPKDKRTSDQIKAIYTIGAKKGLSKDEIKDLCAWIVSQTSLDYMTRSDASSLIDGFEDAVAAWKAK